MSCTHSKDHTPKRSNTETLFTRNLQTNTRDMARIFHDKHSAIMNKCAALRDMDPDFFHKHFEPIKTGSNSDATATAFEMNLAGFLVLANMMDDQHYMEYLKEVQSVCIDLDIILRGPMTSVRKLAWSVPLEDMAETIKANLTPLLGTELTDQEQRRRDFAFALIDRLSPENASEPHQIYEL